RGRRPERRPKELRRLRTPLSTAHHRHGHATTHTTVSRRPEATDHGTGCSDAPEHCATDRVPRATLGTPDCASTRSDRWSVRQPRVRRSNGPRRRTTAAARRPGWRRRHATRVADQRYTPATPHPHDPLPAPQGGNPPPRCPRRTPTR